MTGCALGCDERVAAPEVGLAPVVSALAASLTTSHPPPKRCTETEEHTVIYRWGE